uniref:NCK-interacting protein with SH3 domain-like n=1 Tax=Saccoglossus kowalevskii TaxID=10224 RepID=A0ABM0MVZ3_SACKO|nr:PREDICTED: NCK-interacting protein with SH3 domain-like [Saccoglossus kowalevskii]
MYRALYKFDSKDQKTLSFSEDDKFTLLDSSHGNWLQVMNVSGRVGFVPANYIKKYEVSNDELLQSIDRAIESVHLVATQNGGNYTKEQRTCLQKLIKHRSEVLEQQSKDVPQQPRRKAPEPPNLAASRAATTPAQKQDSQARRSSLKSQQQKQSEQPAMQKQHSQNQKQLPSPKQQHQQPSPKQQRPQQQQPAAKQQQQPTTKQLQQAAAKQQQQPTAKQQQQPTAKQLQQAAAKQQQQPTATQQQQPTATQLQQAAAKQQQQPTATQLQQATAKQQQQPTATQQQQPTPAHQQQPTATHQQQPTATQQQQAAAKQQQPFSHQNHEKQQSSIQQQQQQQESTNQQQQSEKRSSIKTHKAPSPPASGGSLLESIQTVSKTACSNDSITSFGSSPMTPPLVTSSLSLTPSTSMLASKMMSRTFSPSSSVMAVSRTTSLNVAVPDGIAFELVDIVRANTNLNFEKCKIAVGTTLSHIGMNIPAVASVMERILKSLRDGPKDDDVIESGYDRERLEVIFSELITCKEDSQQRSWALHEDEPIILEYLEELVSILNDANPKICKAIVCRDSYDSLQSLVVYYQMEKRLSIRLALLKVFGALCGLDPMVISHLVMSILPMELARDIQTNCTELQRVFYSSLVLTMILSSGEPLPYSHYDHLNESFVAFLFDNVESPPPEDIDEQLPELFISLILAFNLHFQVPSSNFVMKILAKRKTAKHFSEKIMLLVNRGGGY